MDYCPNCGQPWLYHGSACIRASTNADTKRIIELEDRVTELEYNEAARQNEKATEMVPYA